VYEILMTGPKIVFHHFCNNNFIFPVAQSSAKMKGFSINILVT